MQWKRKALFKPTGVCSLANNHGGHNMGARGIPRKHRRHAVFRHLTTARHFLMLGSQCLPRKALPKET